MNIIPLARFEICLFILSFFVKAAGWALGLALGLYLLIVFIAGAHLATKNKDISYCLGVPLATLCMHFSWGTGFLWGLFRPIKQN